MRKIEIVARITGDSGAIMEKSLMSWPDTDYWHNQPLTSPILNYPGLEIRLNQRRVIKNGVEIRLSRYEYGVLAFLAQHPGTLFTKEQIFEAVWHEDSESCLSAITNTISRIRQKIEDNKDEPIYIQTISNLGYLFAPDPLGK